jgi:hypothetical protein
MKKLILLFALSAIFVNTKAGNGTVAEPPSQFPSASITGNASCHFPYNDNEAITLHITDMIDDVWYEIAFPTNYLPGHPKAEIAREVAAWIKVSKGQIALNLQASSSTVFSQVAVVSTGPGSVDFIFNAPNSAYYTFSSLTQWHLGHPTFYLPPNGNQNLYYLSVRRFDDLSHIAKAYFQIV